MSRVKLATSSQAIADLFVKENPGTTKIYTKDRINLSNTSFSIKIAEVAKVLGFDAGQSSEEIWSMTAPLVEVHSRAVTRVDDTHITIIPTKIPTQVRIRPDTSAILADICRTTGLKKVDVLHQAIRDFHLRLAPD